jgi:hypothetical protein
LEKNLGLHPGTTEELQMWNFERIQGRYPEDLSNYSRPSSECFLRSVWEAPSAGYQVQGTNY